MRYLRVRDSPHTATTIEGKRVKRVEKIYVPEYKGWVRVAPYLPHFIYKDPTNVAGRPAYLCTCGSFAVVISSDTYKHLDSGKGRMFVCHHHTTFGRHADGVK